MISGFVSVYTMKTDDEHPANCYFKAFLHKLKRIYPMVTIALLVRLILKTIDVLAFGTGSLDDFLNVKTLILNFLLLFRGWPHFEMMGIVNSTWFSICFFF